MFGWCAETVVVTTGLAGLVVLAGRWFRLAPEARHALWVVVLLKFLLPPVIAWPWAAAGPVEPPSPPPLVPVNAAPPPAPASVPQPRPADEVRPPLPPLPAAAPEDRPLTLAGRPEPPAPPLLPPPPEPEPSLESTPGPPNRPALVPLDPEPVAIRPAPISVPPVGPLRGDPPRWTWLLLACWLGGAVVVGVRGLVRVARFGLSLRGAEPAPGWLVDEVARVGVGLGVRRVPPTVVLVDAPGPLLWCLGPPRLVLPAGLDRMSAEARAGLLAHELAHLVRGDPWVVWLDLAAGLVWWWNPVCRFARRRLRAEAEAACDALVLRAFPEHRFAYAEALVLVCEAHVRPSPPLPALGMGAASAARTLEARLLMILHDPIRPPSRWLAPAALTLLALILPTWTLGQQDPAPPTDPPKVEVPPPLETAKGIDPPIAISESQPNSPDPGSRPSVAVPLDPAWTMDSIREGFRGRRWPDRALTFRCSFVTRHLDESGVKRVSIQAGDVALGNRSISGEPLTPTTDDRLGQSARIDVLTSRIYRSNFLRRFVAETPKDLVTFDAYSDQSNPVALGWLPARGADDMRGDDLVRTLANQTMSEESRSIEPLDPRPVNLLDLQGSTPLLFREDVVRMERAGIEVVDGVAAVRVAWITQPGFATQVHGLCWVAPTLGFAVIRVEASTNPASEDTRARRSWRKVSSNFKKVGELWLPRKVTYQTTERLGEASPTRTFESIATFEEYQANPPITADTFRPRFDIAALDSATGNFTANPPEVPSGLVDFLNRTEAASPFGPPRVETYPPSQAPISRVATIQGSPSSARSTAPTPAAVERESRPADADPRRTVLDDAVNQAARRLAKVRAAARDPKDAAVVRVEQALNRAVADLADHLKGNPPSATPAVVSQPIDPGVARSRSQPQILQARRDAQAAEVQRVEAERDRVKIEVKNTDRLRQQKAVSQDEADLYQAKLKAAEAAVGREQAKLAEADALLERGRPETVNEPEPARGDRSIFRARRDIQAAEVQRFEAQLKIAAAVVERNRTLNRRVPNSVSSEEIQLGEAKYLAAKAEVAREQARLAEADAPLDQAKSSRAVEPSVATSSGKPPAVLSDYRDQVELAELQLEVKQVEMQRAGAKAERAKQLLDLRTPLAEQGRITNKEIMDTQNDLAEAQNEVKTKGIEVREAELRLKQAKRRDEFEEARLKRLAERTKVELERTRSLYKSGVVDIRILDEVQGRYDDLMFQLDPNHQPESGQPASPAQSTSSVGQPQ